MGGVVSVGRMANLDRSAKGWMGRACRNASFYVAFCLFLHPSCG